MPTNTFLSNKTDLTLDLSLKSSSKRAAMTSFHATTNHPDSDGSCSTTTDSDEIKVFECDKHEEDVNVDDDGTNSDRLSPVIKEEEPSPPQQTAPMGLTDRLNSEHQFHGFFPCFMPAYGNGSSFDKMVPLNSLSKFISPPPAHMSNANLNADLSTGMVNSMYPLATSNSFPSPYSQHWRPNMFPFVFPPGYPFPSNTYPSPNSSSSSSKRLPSNRRVNTASSDHQDAPTNPKSKKSHIKKPLNAFMLFMREQRAQVVQECTLRESAAINQILGRKWHELDRDVQQKYYDMARDERMRHMQLYPGWSARDNYGARKKRSNKGKKREKHSGDSSECLNQKKCRARFGLDQQSNWCKHCKRKKKCLRYTENETLSMDPDSVDMGSWSGDNDTDNADDSNDDDVSPTVDHRRQHNPVSLHAGVTIDSDEENRSRLLNHQTAISAVALDASSSMHRHMSMLASRKDVSFLHPSPHYPYSDSFAQPISNGLKRDA